MKTDSTKTALKRAYNTFKANNLEKHYKLKNAFLDALEAFNMGNLKKGTDFSKGTGLKLSTEIEALARIYNTIFKHNITEENTTDEQFNTFYMIPFTVLETLVKVKSTCKRDIFTKIKVLRSEFADYDLDEIQRTALKVMEYELTGRAGKWGE